MSGAWQSRMQWELKQLSNSPPPGVVAWPADGASLSHLEAQIEGPQDTVYEGGVFRLDIQIPERYPHEPPKVRFVTQVYHPNVTPQTGLICLSTLNLRPKGDWTPATNLSTLMTTIRALLSAPNPDDGLVTEIVRCACPTDQFKQNRAAFDATAREWTARYAKGGVVGPAEPSAGAAAAAAPAVTEQPPAAAAAAEAQPAPAEPARAAGEGATQAPAEAPTASAIAEAEAAGAHTTSSASQEAPPHEAQAAASCGGDGERRERGVDGAGSSGEEGEAGVEGAGGADAENIPPSLLSSGVPPPAGAAPVKRPLAEAAAEAGGGEGQPPAARKRRMQLARPGAAAAAAAGAGAQQPAGPGGGGSSGNADDGGMR